MDSDSWWRWWAGLEHREFVRKRPMPTGGQGGMPHANGPFAQSSQSAREVPPFLETMLGLSARSRDAFKQLDQPRMPHPQPVDALLQFPCDARMRAAVLKVGDQGLRAAISASGCIVEVAKATEIELRQKAQDRTDPEPVWPSGRADRRTAP